MIKPLTHHACIAVALALFVTGAATAASESPQTFIETVFGEVVADLKSYGATPSNTDVRTVFDARLSPHIDYAGIARWTLRRHWQASNETQRRAFLTALRKHVIRTYASALTFDADTALDLDDSVAHKNKMALINGKLSSAGQSTAIDFRLVNQGDAWRLFDVQVEGISLAKALRADFQNIAAAGGIDAVTEALSNGRLLLSQR